MYFSLQISRYFGTEGDESTEHDSRCTDVKIVPGHKRDLIFNIFKANILLSLFSRDKTLTKNHCVAVIELQNTPKITSFML